MPISCASLSDCPVMYVCTSNLVCQHEPVLPLHVFSGFIYFVLMPIGVAICNVGGLSSAALRLPILMGFLNFPLSQAGPFSQGIAVGASLANFILLLPKRHPVRDTSLVDFLVVFIQMPPLVFGIVIGLLLSKFTPLLYRDIVMIGAFMFFAVFFFQKWRKHVATPINRNKGMAPLEAFVQSKLAQNKGTPAFIEMSTFNKNKQRSQDTKSNWTDREARLSDLDSIEAEAAMEKRLLRDKIAALRLDIERQHAGIQWKNIGGTFIMFAFFDSLLMLVTGRFVQFGFCTWNFGVGITAYVFLQCGYQLLLYRIVKKQMQLYRWAGYEYEVGLDSKKTYLWISTTAFLGGFFQGIAATGAGSSIVAVLLSSGYPQKVSGASSGYLALFMAIAATIHSVLHNELTLLQFAWFSGISFVLGGSFTILLYRKIEQKPQGSGVLMILISGICLICVISVVPNFIQTLNFEGWDALLTASKAFCDYL